MRHCRSREIGVIGALIVMYLMALSTASLSAQQQSESAQQQPATSDQPDMRDWQLMQDGIAFFTFNRQGGERGGSEFKSQNWWMGMAGRQLGRGTLNLNTMLSLDPATVGKRGYRELFQSGEAANGQPLVDRQHPHDFVGQLAASWRVPLNQRTGLTIAGGPIAEPALGPVFFAHRPSAAENPTSPLGHHTFDSSHISMGVMTLALDRGPWMLEGSLFNGREPDDDRWDFMDPGALDSWSTRLWLRPSNAWEFQVSHGFLKEPEELEPGNLRRTTASVGWMRESREEDFTAATLALGRNDKEHGAFHGFLAEATRRFGMNSLYGRLEVQQVESALLLTGRVPESEEFEKLRDTVTALTIGGVRDIWRASGYEVGLGGDVVFYGVPQRLERGAGVCGVAVCALGAAYGSRPVSFHIFMRVRPPARMGRMWNMTLTRPMKHGGMRGGHEGHQMGGAQQMSPAADPAHADHAPASTVKPSTGSDPHAGHQMSPPPGKPAKSADPHAAHNPSVPASRNEGPAGAKVSVSQATDPVCGLKVDPNTAPQAAHQGETYHFCSEEHRQLFEQNPAKYLPKPSDGTK
jgi:YHS domain-containing protein